MNLTTQSQAVPLAGLTSAGREIEIKFLATAEAFKAAQGWEPLGPTRPRAQRLRNVYFDTPDGDLHRHGSVLRLRRLGRRRLLTFKWRGKFAGGAFERGEMEVPTPSELADPALLGVEIAGLIETMCQGQALLPVYETEVKRIIYLVRGSASEIEVAFDTGRIQAGGQSVPIREIEMELKSGEPAALYQLGLALAEAFPVTLGCQSKAERAALAYTGAAPGILHAPRSMAQAANVDAAIGDALNSCVSHFLGNWPAFHAGDRVGAVHQMRVALRRLRAVLGVFQRAFPCAEFMQFRQQAKDMATVLGGARDWDVFIDMMRQGPMAAFPEDAGFETLLADAQAQREEGYAKAAAMLAAAGSTGFILAVQAFIARHGWRNGPSGEALPSLTAPAEDFFSEHLARIRRRILKTGRGFKRMTPYYRHELRKNLKKLRYLLDLSGGLCGWEGENRKMLRLAAALQDQLGLFNDLAAAREMVGRLRIGDDLAAARAAGVVLGWCARAASTDDAALRMAWKKFKKERIFFL